MVSARKCYFLDQPILILNSVSNPVPLVNPIHALPIELLDHGIDTDKTLKPQAEWQGVSLICSRCWVRTLMAFINKCG